MLIAAISGRALASAAERGGYDPLVADLFGDLDTRLTAAAFELLPGGLERGMVESDLVAALSRLADGRAPLGLVCGSGFEARSGLISRLAERWPLFGNGPEVVARLKDPFEFARLTAKLAIPHPEVRRSRPENPAGWLAKLAGAAGGWHIRPAEEAADTGDGWYFQRRIEGKPVSALFLADGRAARVVGFSRQWSDPVPGRPFRYGGAVRLASVEPGLSETMTAAVEAVAAAAGLVGLNSADFLVSAENVWLLEVNPRPGATIDVFHDRHGRLFAAHVKACRGEFDPEPLLFDGAAAAAIVYATREVPRVPAIDWPEWSADRQPPDTSVAAGGPLCTVLAAGGDAEGAVCLVRERGEMIRGLLERQVP